MDSNYTKIFSGNFILAQGIINQLKEVGIVPIIKDESESGRLAGFGSAIQGNQEIYVHSDELEKAKPIVQEVLKT
ncbi:MULTISPECIES: putative signal transducing protein [unclassified Arenibacter]|jgi:hypothetical protein|uniref:putative signal transducing protein n=1 Tax=unclassified Arenibacter TaxID=2615047 RepID=UPI000E352C90|nr:MULTISPECIES: DUF2007 domain-containing protein [unclassified Arenibacter]MCM4165230.1 hypothetical protein [Arenibacter sp. A80]RFT55086.1 DUF2007 domain-containing protein [Arenibacter sp. P308M17]